MKVFDLTKSHCTWLIDWFSVVSVAIHRTTVATTAGDARYDDGKEHDRAKHSANNHAGVPRKFKMGKWTNIIESIRYLILDETRFHCNHTLVEEFDIVMTVS